MKRLALAAALVMTTGLIVQAQQTTPPAQTPPSPSKPDEKEKPKPDAKAAPTVAGKWNLSVETQQGAMASVLDLKVDGKKVTGTITSQMGPDPAPIEGEFTDGKLTLSLSFQGSNGTMQIAFNGAFKEDGTLAGTMDIAAQNMQIPWKAERVK